MVETWNLPRGQIAWLFAGLLLTLVVAFMLYSFLGALVVGVFLYYAVRPVARWLTQYSDRSGVTAGLSPLLVGLPMLVVVLYGGFVGSRELNQLLAATGTEGFRSDAGRLLGYANTVFTRYGRLFASRHAYPRSRSRCSTRSDVDSSTDVTPSSVTSRRRSPSRTAHGTSTSVGWRTPSGWP